MTEKDYTTVGFLHDARICLYNAQSCLDRPLKPVDNALRLVEQALDDTRFYVSVTTDEAWIGSDGMYVDFGTFDGHVGGSERLSHHVRPLPGTLDDFLGALAAIVEALPQSPKEDR